MVFYEDFGCNTCKTINILGSKIFKIVERLCKIRNEYGVMSILYYIVLHVIYKCQSKYISKVCIFFPPVFHLFSISYLCVVFYVSALNTNKKT